MIRFSQCMGLSYENLQIFDHSIRKIFLQSAYSEKICLEK